MIDWIDAAHRFPACLFFDDMRDESGRARDHENAVECRRIHSQIGEDGAVHIDWKRFLRIGERFLNCSRRLRVPGGELASFSREFLALTISVNATGAAAALGAVAVLEQVFLSRFPKPHARE